MASKKYKNGKKADKAWFVKGPLEFQLKCNNQAGCSDHARTLQASGMKAIKKAIPHGVST